MTDEWPQREWTPAALVISGNTARDVKRGCVRTLKCVSACSAAIRTFPNEIRQLVTYQLQELPDLRQAALARCHKALNDAVLLDTRNPERIKRMRTLFDKVAGDRPLDPDTVVAIDRELQDIFASYLEDRAIAFWKRFS